MSANNGVVRIGRKGIKKFAFGEDGQPFEVDIVVAFQEWIGVDSGFRDDVNNTIKTEDMPLFHQAAVAFVERQSGVTVTAAEALDFLARLREQYDELAIFFQPKPPEKHVSRGISVSDLQFSAEEN